MFAFNQGAIHFNALEPDMAKMKQRQMLIETIGHRLHITKQQACRITAYFFTGPTSISQVSNDISFLKKHFQCSTDAAIEMLHIRIPLRFTLSETIRAERLLMGTFSNEMVIKLLTYGNTKTLAGFKTGLELMKYLSEKTMYLSQRDSRTFTIQEIANIYLNGD